MSNQPKMIHNEDELSNTSFFPVSFSPEAFPQALPANNPLGTNLDSVFNLILHYTSSKQDPV